MFGWLFSEPLPPGTVAPDFTLSDDQGNEVKLSSLRGSNVVLVFYPGDDTPVCTRQLCEFRDRWDDTATRGIAVFGVNPASAGIHAKFRGKHNFPFPLLADKGRKVAGLYHAAGLLVKRTVYLIGPDGTVRYAKRGKPGVDEVLAAVK